ncbi:hypothetical protein C7J88_02700 [Staphylococcus muscae]|uniref:Putative staphylococcal protein n=1 Tax=Staphylococcus muscae TaxID=1294 RepID=A0A240C5W7_9STAP|nr:hypothetical protein [Staphylococcus muscae]AVQ33162.1 hypothetical protein C7J88_02700 [Staphylococcus muscae]PNZ05658.1 hypothetical protein CD131_01890 [Staphylococcus muscae]GGA95565.1 hypothetical protein GCM10007183_19680 [Staphylococcus muscae]SNW02673.1 putative staphylococcal protein [Staphylococcus muscae]
MTMLNNMSEIEKQLDILAQSRKIGKPESIALLDEYYELLVAYFCYINEIQHIGNIPSERLPIVPFNFDERLSYIQERKHHYMGYQQMKTLKSELIKMNAAYRVKHN